MPPATPWARPGSPCSEMLCRFLRPIWWNRENFISIVMPTANTGWISRTFRFTAWTLWTFTTWAALESWAGSLLQHMNSDHSDALVLLARTFAGIESQEAAMTSVDRLGFHLRLKTEEGMRGARIAFLREVRSPAEARTVLIEMTHQARQR